jgi:hypothetical protein
MLRQLRGVFNGAMLRTVAGIVDVGEAVLAFFGDPDGGDHVAIADDKSDVWVRGQDASQDPPTRAGAARLFIPMNMLFRLPKKDESYLKVRGANADGPGKPYAFYGDCGAQNQVPDWLDSDNAGIKCPETLHLESEKDVTLTAGSGRTVAANGDGFSGFNTEDFDTDLDAFLSTVAGIATPVVSLPQCAAALNTIIAAAIAWQSAKAAHTNPNYRSTKFKHG